jgi:hypothetical protein
MSRKTTTGRSAAQHLGVVKTAVDLPKGAGHSSVAFEKPHVREQLLTYLPSRRCYRIVLAWLHPSPMSELIILVH